MAFRISERSLRQSGVDTQGAVQATVAFLRRLPPLFIGVVLVPALFAAVYYFVLASPVYVSQATFIVRAPTQSPPVAGMGLDAVLQGVGLAPAATDSFVVQDYMSSRDAIDMLVSQHHLRDAMGRSLTDFIVSFPRPFERPTLENLALAYPRFVEVNFNSSTGVSTLKVKAFDPRDAQDIANALLGGGETVINHLNDRAEQDAIADTRRQIEEAEAQLSRAEDKLTAFRNRERLIDPTRSSQVNLELMGKLDSDLATLRAERAGLAAGAPQSPQLASLDSRINAYKAQAQDQEAQMAGQAGSLAPLIGEYERLQLERDFADKTLASAASAAEQAQQEARRKRLYLERISNPSMPDSAAEPHRLSGFITAVVTLLLVYGLVALGIAGLREHRQV
jgi:capsular polysaccharide transport system permease protein